PSHAAPEKLIVYVQNRTLTLDLQPVRPLLINLRALLREHDPDLLLTTWGDTWLIPELLRLAVERRLYLPLNRDPRHGVLRKAEKVYFSYGQVIHRGQQVHLFGRWHIDRANAMLWGDYGLEGILELARITGLPVQTVARTSPGTGISSMQILTALRMGVLVPWHKQQTEDPRSATDLFYADQGGLVYQPVIGVHSDVAEIDFVSMYPSIMVHYNISPETVGAGQPHAELIPELNMRVDRSRPGLVPLTLKPLLEKRIELKQRIGELPAWKPVRKRYAAWASAYKWLLVTCFGYLGYKNARFGRIEAHQAVTAYGRETLLLAKEAAEEQGFTVLHLYVDGMWVRRDGARQVSDFQLLLDRIAEVTRLPIGLDGIYRWVAFLPSRRSADSSRSHSVLPGVANRYFGVFQDGSVKMRGIETRRLDTPPFISRLQLELLDILGRAEDAGQLPERFPLALQALRRTASDLRAGQIPIADCVVTQKLSRTLEEFRTASPAARALAQLGTVGKSLRPGQRVRFVYILGEQRVRAWDLPGVVLPEALDHERYLTLLLCAASAILQPMGFEEAVLRDWILGGAVYLGLPGRWRLEDGLEPGVGLGLLPPRENPFLLPDFISSISSHFLPGERPEGQALDAYNQDDHGRP
ncbi:MAG TPA: DNA polymerase domain-containing protein, partial [Anaerolineaceae bacterium]